MAKYLTKLYNVDLQYNSWLAKGLPGKAASVEKLLQPASKGSSFERASRLIRGCYVQIYIIQW